MPGTVAGVDAGVPGSDPPIQVEFESAGGVVSRSTEVARTCPRREATTRAAASAWSLSESDFRELDYTHAGDFDQWWTPSGAPCWLSTLRDARAVVEPRGVSSWLGHNTFVHVSPSELAAVLPTIRAALATHRGRARVTVLVGRASGDTVAVGERAGDGELLELLAAGFAPVRTFGAGVTCVHIGPKP